MGLAGFLSVGDWWRYLRQLVVALREMGDGGFYLKRQAIWPMASWSLPASHSPPTCGAGCAGPAQAYGWAARHRRHPGDGHHGQWREPLAGDWPAGAASELVKPFVVLQAANLFALSRMSLDQKLLWLGSFGGLLLLILKPNLSTALMGLTLWMVAMAAGLRWRSLLGTALAGSVMGRQHSDQ